MFCSKNSLIISKALVFVLLKPLSILFVQKFMHFSKVTNPPIFEQVKLQISLKQSYKKKKTIRAKDINKPSMPIALQMVDK